MPQNEYKKMLKRQKRHDDALERKEETRMDTNNPLARAYTVLYYVMITLGVLTVGSTVVVFWAKLGLTWLALPGAILLLFVCSDLAKNKVAHKFHNKANS